MAHFIAVNCFSSISSFFVLIWLIQIRIPLHDRYIVKTYGLVMSMNNKKPSNICKAVQMVYGFPGDLKVGWEAERVDDTTFMLVRSDGSTREINVRKPLRTLKGDVFPEYHSSGVLKVGDWSVIVGRGLNHGMHARKLSMPNTYLVFDEKMRQKGRFKIGSKVDGEPVSLVDGHLLKLGEEIIPIQPKKYDVTLLVMDVPVDGGYLSYINVIELGNSLNRRDGAKGVFMRPRREGEPAEFVETFAGQKVVTARFWEERNSTRVKYVFRDAQSAINERMLQKELFEAKEVAIQAGIEPTEYHEYDEILDKINALNASWKEAGMAIVHGEELFQASSKNRSSNMEP